MKNKSLITIAVCITAVALWIPATASAAEKSASPAASDASASPAAAKAPRPIPFHGVVSAVDHTASTFTITGKQKSRVFKVTEKTAMTKGANAATIKDVAENQEISGSYWKNADGSFEAKTVKVGAMKTGEKAAEKADKSKKPAASPAASPIASPKKP